MPLILTALGSALAMFVLIGCFTGQPFLLLLGAALISRLCFECPDDEPNDDFLL